LLAGIALLLFWCLAGAKVELKDTLYLRNRFSLLQILSSNVVIIDLEHQQKKTRKKTKKTNEK
jgi:hypothetical protein